MKNKVIRVLLTGIVVVGLVQAYSGSTRADNASEILFKSKCAPCHGPDGKAQTPMGKSLKVRDFGTPEVQSQSDAQLTEIVTKGKNKMPAFDGKVTKEQITGLVAYVANSGKNNSSPYFGFVTTRGTRWKV